MKKQQKHQSGTKRCKKPKLFPLKDDARVVLIKDDTVTFIHSDDLESLSDLGEPTIKRLSDVTYNNATGLWEVVFKGKVLAEKRTRKEAICWEVAYFNKQLGLGKFNG